MEVSKKFLNLIRKALSESFDNRSMAHIMHEFVPNYNLLEKVGTQDILSVSRLEVAQQIVSDIKDKNLLIQFANVILGVHFNGYKGKKINISGVHDILKELYGMGFVYDTESNTIIEDPRYRVSKNWGMLIDGEDYFFAFLWIDITGYSRLVKKYPKNIINQLYKDFLMIIRASVEKRNGRIWNIEGDGLLCSFYFGNKSQVALLSAIEVLHKVFTYNKIKNPLEDPLRIKLSLHSGMCTYNDDLQKTIAAEVVHKTVDLEKNFKKSDTIIVSMNVNSMIDPVISRILVPSSLSGVPEYYTYSIEWDS